MNHVINFKEGSNRSVVIDISDTTSIVSITVPSTELYSADKENACAFKVNEDGKIIINCKTSEDSIEISTTITKEEIKAESLVDTFEKIPEGLSEAEVIKLIEFVTEKAPKGGGCSRIYPYSVSETESGDIKITFVIYNADKIQLNLQQISLKLTDANKSIIIAGSVDINAVVNCGKIGIFESIVSKEKLKENTINLKKWNINFIV
ncbi:SLAP domain-containing protein [Clostridium tagluense]|uniref:SLAP domain-containing protein n=1 Tax=Clostridium tagluense TaxID=360422 RepID=UPI001CF29D99|nr:SLAP domain-containing protein [Clostridium tagluense]MCB2312043.1 SLAP domain-containing protein [Clostridium tagluense]MCB2316630.1 SLAP domain-containing protein [Clostridium tagluense]MCB2321434.1 SLAP domain-containing protein [Clostridium tagluense]MCB2326446.1 SLAP domain-containing protein [Clostridium tagluense]MCB2331222.1 SLAP domain-containing protein [Clostridium tagluense]